MSKASTEAVYVGAVLLVTNTVLNIALVRIIRRLLRPEIDMFEWGYEAGERHGYREGHEVARPVVVPMGDQNTG